MDRDGLAGFGIGLLAGVLIGGIVASLYAPRSGKETRKMLKSRASDVVDHVKDFTAKTEDKGEALANGAWLD